MKSLEERRPAASSVLYGVQFLRFVAALAVVVYHANLVSIKFTPGTLLPGADAILELGASGVHVFFVISGFIMVHTATGKSGWKEAVAFWLRRATRIYPIYWIIALSYLTLYGLFFSGYTLSISAAILALLLVPGWEALIIGPAWTLSYEVFFYICFGASLLFRPGLSLWVLTALFAILVGTGLWWPLPIGVVGNPLLLEFIAGAWIARLLPGMMWRQRLSGTVLVAVGIAGFAAGLFVDHTAIPKVILWGPPSILLVAGVALLDKSARAVPAFSKVSVLGDASYVLYLAHILILDIVMSLLVWSGSVPDFRLVSILIGVAASAAAAILIHTAIERPLLGNLRKWVKFKTTAPPPPPSRR